MTRTGLILLAATLFLAGCKDPSAPKQTFNVCVHAQDAPFTPGSTGDDCAVPQQLRAGQTRTVDIEADLYAGDPRSGTIQIEFSPNGWTVALGGSTIAVPGKQTLTMTVPQNAIPGVYQIAVSVTSAGEKITLAFAITVQNPV